MTSLSPPARQSFAGLFVIGLGASLAPMDLAVNVAFPAITAAFSLETRAIRWVVVCYVLTYASLMLAFGRVGDRIGHRVVFRAGLVASVAAYLLCALAPTYPWLLAARIVQGIATALVLSCAPALVLSLFAEARRTRALGAYGSMNAFASIAAPLVGGASIAALGWSGVFWFRAPLALAALLLLPLLPRAPQADAPAPQAFDLAGALLLSAGIALLLLSPALAHSDAASGLAAVPALSGTAALIAFAVQQRRVPEPIFPIAALRDIDFLLHNAASVALHFVAFAVPLLVPYHLAGLGRFGPAEIGALLALSPAGMLLGSMLAPPVARFAGSASTALAGGVLVAVGTLLIARWPASPAPALAGACLLLHGTGVGLFQIAYTDIVVSTLPRNARGIAGSLAMVTRTIGVVGAVTALTAVLQVLERRHLALGGSVPAAFESAFGTIFLYAGSILGMLFALGSLRRCSSPGR